jgi:hypothetical protein
MNAAEIQTWFDDLAARRDRVGMRGTYAFEEPAASSWLTEVQSALAAVFPNGHPLRTTFDRTFHGAKSYEWSSDTYFIPLTGAFNAAHNMVKTGRVQSLIAGLQAETVMELLDQAATLGQSNYPVAAMVIAGGALESHLLHLCGRHNLTWNGDGSIGKYDGAIAAARNAGTVTVYSQADTKSMGTWGADRNTAAHTPANFHKSSAEVLAIIEGIRGFISRVP